MLTVSNYHYIRDDFSAPYPSIFGLTPSFFKNQLEAIKEVGTYITPKELIDNTDEVLKSSENYVLITFDDGLKEQYLKAKPILEELGIEALFFINSLNFIDQDVSLVHKIHLLRSQIATSEFFKILKEFDKQGKTVLSPKETEQAIVHYNYDDEETACLKFILNFKLSIKEQHDLIRVIFDAHFDKGEVVKGLYMTEAQLRDLADQGLLGNHTHSHMPLGYLEREEIQKEFDLSAGFLREITGNEIPYVSYPYGSDEACAAPVRDIAKSKGHQIGFTMERNINIGTEDPLLLKRFDCNDLPKGKNEIAFKNARSLIHQ